MGICIDVVKRVLRYKKGYQVEQSLKKRPAAGELDDIVWRAFSVGDVGATRG